MSHPRIPDLPSHVQDGAAFRVVMDDLFEFYKDADYPLRISGFGTHNGPDMMGGVMFSVFENPRREPIGAVRTITPMPDVFDVVADLRDRLRNAGVLISYLEGDPATHVLTIARPGIPDQTWNYGINADDAKAFELFVLHGCTDIRYPATVDAEEAAQYGED